MINYSVLDSDFDDDGEFVAALEQKIIKRGMIEPAMIYPDSDFYNGRTAYLGALTRDANARSDAASSYVYDWPLPSPSSFDRWIRAHGDKRTTGLFECPRGTPRRFAAFDEGSVMGYFDTLDIARAWAAKFAEATMRSGMGPPPLASMILESA
jgi:hypothetical protein